MAINIVFSPDYKGRSSLATLFEVSDCRWRPCVRMRMSHPELPAIEAHLSFTAFDPIAVVTPGHHSSRHREYEICL